MKNLDVDHIRRSINEEGFFKFEVDGKSISLTDEDLKFEENIKLGFGSSSFSLGKVYLDCNVDVDLMAEGLAREVVRRLQEMRKELDLSVESYIDASVSVEDEELLSLLERMKWYVLQEVRVKNLSLSKASIKDAEYIREWMIEGKRFVMGITPLE